MSAKTDEYPSLHFQDIKKKNSIMDGHTDGQRENSIPPPPLPTKFAGGIIIEMSSAEFFTHHAKHQYLL